MTLPIFRTLLLATCLGVAPMAAEAQQRLVPTAPARTVVQPRPVAPAPSVAADWPANSRAAQVIQRQLQSGASGRGPGMSGAEASRIYQNYMQGMGTPLQGTGGSSSDSGAQSTYGSPR